MNRAQRRQRERSAQNYDNRKTFTKQELEDMNTHAFKIGTAMALYAAQQTMGLGEVRMDRMRKAILELEDKFILNGSMEALPFDTLDILRYRGVDRKNAVATAKKD
jgi:hypothetical protein